MLTDNEIIKALECCAYSDDCGNGECPYEHGQECIRTLMLDALSFINRQKAEIERLNSVYKAKIESVNLDVKELIQQYRHEAIKEFAERLVYTLILNNEHNTISFDFNFTIETIDNLVKEMVGEDK
jgi:hypothetical protein